MPNDLRQVIEEVFDSPSDETIKNVVAVVNRAKRAGYFSEKDGESRTDEGGVVEENSISDVASAVDPSDMNVILRTSKHESDVHFSQVWDTEYGKKVGVNSPFEAKEVFTERLDWDVAHHKWTSPRVSETEMWECDLDALWYVAVILLNDGFKVSVEDEVIEEYLASLE